MFVALMIAVARKAEQVGTHVDVNESQLSDELGVPRTYPYELVPRVEERLESLFDRRPGRPPSPTAEPELTALAESQLSNEILRYRADHPGAVVRHGGRSTYSPEFRRMVLGLHDRLVPGQMGDEAFAHTAEIPVDTLNDWLKCDRGGLEQEAEQADAQRQALRMPADASKATRALVENLQSWEGSLRDFIPFGAAVVGLKPAQVRRVCQILGLITPRRRGPPRYRGATEAVAPGAVGVQDGKQVDIVLTGSGQRDKRTVQMQADQATQVITGHVVVQDECAAGGVEVFRKSVTALGGQPPAALLVDNKPCYKEEEFRAGIEKTTMIIQSTKGRPQNNAVAEGGVFSEFEHAVGTITLDDTSTEALVSSAVSEVFRAFSSARNTTPCAEYDGYSRLAVLQSYRPSFEQQRHDEDFLRHLKARHEAKYPSFEDERSRALLDEGFARWQLLDKDPSGALRRYLSYCSPAAVTLGFAIFAAKKQRDVLDNRYDHRYLAKLITSCQEEEDLRYAEDELLKLFAADQRWWTNHEEEAYRELLETCPDHEQRACQVAERAALETLPVAAAFWRAKLKAEVAQHPQTATAVRRHIKRLYEAQLNVRLDLLATVVGIGIAA